MPDKRKRAARDRFHQRRTLIGTAGGIGVGAIAGCLGDDDEEPADDTDDTDDADDDPDPGDDTDDTDLMDDTDDRDPDDHDDSADDVEPIERHDVTQVLVQGPPLPVDSHFNEWAGAEVPVSGWVTGDRDCYATMRPSMADQEMAGMFVSDWDYQPGLLEVTFHDDFFWWSGDKVTVEDWISQMHLRDWDWGGDDLDAHPAIVTAETIDDQTMRLSLADVWREEWALRQSVAEVPECFIFSSRAFNEPWLERFQDTGGDMDAVSELREEFDTHVVDEDSDELVDHFHIPFEFRGDGSIGDIGEDYIELELVPEKNGTLRHYVDRINYTTFRVEFTEETGVHSMEAFLQEDKAFTRDADVLDDGGIEFDMVPVMFYRDIGMFGFTFNCEVSPTESPQFRRAWTYMMDRTLWDAPNREAQEHVTPFLTDDRLERWVSGDVIESFTDFGKDEVRWDDAEFEMELGGFERNGDGDWIDPDDGEPIDITLGSHTWMGWVSGDASDFFADINEFGIDTDHVTQRNADDPWTVEALYHGGVIPEFVFSSVFGEESLAWGANNPNLPESVFAPEVGDTDADPDGWVEYDSGAMTDRLGVTVDQAPYQEMVDQLAWIANQIQPRALATAFSEMFIMNDNRWHLVLPEDSPETWQWPPDQQMYFNGNLSYVPEADR